MEYDADRNGVLARVRVRIPAWREENVQHAGVIEYSQDVFRRDRSREPLGGWVEDVEVAVGVVLPSVVESEPGEILLQVQELTHAFVAVRTDAVANLDIDLLGPRRLLDRVGILLLRGSNAGADQNGEDRECGSCEAHGVIRCGAAREPNRHRLACE